MIISELFRKIFIFLVSVIGIIMLLFGVAVWLTNGTIVDRIDYKKGTIKKVENKVIHDTIYLPQRSVK